MGCVSIEGLKQVVLDPYFVRRYYIIRRTFEHPKL